DDLLGWRRRWQLQPSLRNAGRRWELRALDPAPSRRAAIHRRGPPGQGEGGEGDAEDLLYRHIHRVLGASRIADAHDRRRPNRRASGPDLASLFLGWS